FPDYMNAAEISAYLTDWTNRAVEHQLEAMRCVFVTRVSYEAWAGNGITESRIEELAQEAWAAFGSSSLYAFATWLFEPNKMPLQARDDSDPEIVAKITAHLLAVDEEIRAETDEIVGEMRKSWFDWVDAVKPQFVL